MVVKFNYIFSGDLTAWLYFLKIRSGKNVHPVVKSLTSKIGSEFEKVLGLSDIYQRPEFNYLERSKDQNKI